MSDVPGGLTLVGAALHLAREIRRVQDQTGAEVSLVGSIPFTRRTRVTSQLSPGTLRLSARARVGAIEFASLGLGLDIMTCCPCMQAYALEEIARYAGLMIDDPREVIGTVPIATHSQKGTVVARVRGPAAALAGLTFGQVYEALATAVHPTGELLKRPDEYDLVRRAHLRPQFVEDVVREVVVAMGTACSGLSDRDGDVKISVAATSLESIHGHDIAARKTITLGALRALLASGH